MKGRKKKWYEKLREQRSKEHRNRDVLVGEVYQYQKQISNTMKFLHL